MKLKVDGAKSETFAAVSAYHPDSGKPDSDHETFYDAYNEFLSDFAKEDDCMVSGCDANCPVGIAENDDERLYCGKFGDPYRRDNQTDQLFRSTIQLHDLRVSASDFKHKRYHTWYSTGLGLEAQIDHLLVSRKKRRDVHDAKRAGNGAESDHAAMKLKLWIQPKRDCREERRKRLSKNRTKQCEMRI